MPLDDAGLQGTEKDGSKSRVYCKYCYWDGRFTRPDMTLDEMRSHLAGLMKPSGMTDQQVKEHLAGLPHLLRWLGSRETTTHD
jgi:hypothetical protein